MNLLAVWSLTLLVICAGGIDSEECPWKRIADPCHPLAHPDGSDITCAVEVRNCTGVPFECRYLSACPSDQCSPATNSSRRRRAATSLYYRLWPRGVVPYVISTRSGYSEYQKGVILDAMRHWEDKTCLRFKKRTTEFSYIIYTSGSCCCSLVGRFFGPQRISLNRGNCVYFSTVVHEIGHAIGYWHEHNRPDRDEHVNVYMSRISPRLRNNFDRLLSYYVNSHGTPYDAISIMHYREYAFSSTGQRTIESKHGIPLGGRELSPIDIKQARLMYRCPADPKNDPPKMVPPPADSLPPELPDEAKACGKVLTGKNGSFSSPNYPGSYPENTTCGWVIQVPEGYTVTLTLNNISLDSPQPYCADRIEVYSGLPRYGSLRRRFCTNPRTGRMQISSFSRVMYVRFKSDAHDGNATGFLARFEAKDYNECSSRYRCPYTCVNTMGSYKCECPTGLFSPMVNKRYCLDHNECMDNKGGCSHKCINTYRSYMCTCPNGMKLGSDKKTCTSISNPCLAARCHHACRHTGSTAQCYCRAGYVLNADKRTCRNPCSNAGCQHSCRVAGNAAQCYCRTGFILNSDRRTCSNPCIGAGCQHSCRINGRAAQCYCRQGFTLNSDRRSCTDRNECVGTSHGCQHSCVNTPGSYRCACRTGFVLGPDKKSCRDDDECRYGRNGCNHRCHNTVGSFYCSCHNSGYTLLPSGRCEDINECSTNNGGCSQTCINRQGSYTCACRAGFRINSDGKTCADINECDRNGGICQHTCVNTPGSFRCECNAGFALDGNRRSCRDLNECANRNAGCDDVCTNVPGSYHCRCTKADLVLNPKDNHTCISPDSNCSPGTHGCQSICSGTNCRCEPGYELSRSRQHCIDSNECLVSKGGCSHFCVNNVGAYECHCPPGLQLDFDDKTCVPRSCELRNGNCDQNCFTSVHNEVKCSCRGGFVLNVDEKGCIALGGSSSIPGLCGMPCDSNGTCVRDDSSGDSCQCNAGYRLREDGVTCEDIDECREGTSQCSHGCENSEGSYSCSCPTGFRLSEDDHNCADINECEELRPCQAGCDNTIGSYQCKCPTGFRLMPDGRNCADINECSEGTSGCSHECMNTAGSYQCLCPEGRINLGGDEHTCADFNECEDSSTNLCEDICNNTDGGYKCSCREGRVLSYDGFHCQDPCGGEVGAPGSISTPVSETGVGSSSFTECAWSVTANGSNVVKVNMPQAAGTSPQDGCENYWEFRNGPDARSPLLEKHCGSYPSGLVQSSCPTMHVKWHSGTLPGPVSTVPVSAGSLDLGPKGKSSCGGILNAGFISDFVPDGFPAVITKPKTCNWLLVKPPRKAKLHLTFVFFDVAGNIACSDNRVEVFDGTSRRIETLCSKADAGRSFTLQQSFSRLVLFVKQPNNFHGFHAKLTTS